MKKTTFLMTALMSSAILGTTVANAANENVDGPLVLDSNATVSFKAEEAGENTDPETEIPGGGGEVEIDPGKPSEPGEGGELPGVVTPGQKGPLMIEFVPNFDFGQDHEIKAADMEFPAKNKLTSKEDETSKVNHFVQVKDTRGGSQGWNLTVKASALTNGTDELSATTIQIKGAHSVGLKDATLAGDVTFDTISFGGADAIDVMSAAKGEGGGRWWKVLATDAETTEDMNNDVTLNIPAEDAAKLSEDTYNSTLTWTLAGLAGSTVSGTPQSK